MPAPIEDYALIGDCETAALVARDGSIDWLCFPRFDSPACFAALLGGPEHGRWQIAPAVEIQHIERRYRGATLILETDYHTDAGEARVIDFMPLRDEVADLIRIVEGRRGTVPMRMELIMRFDYGSIVPWLRRFERGITAIAGPDKQRLCTPVALENKNFRTFAEFNVTESERIAFDLTWFRSYQPHPVEKDCQQQLQSTERWWREWAGRCTYDGKWREPVVRSLITLKALTYHPTGGIVAAPTTSLPERLGGVRNWDYRYCWLRDATFTLYALINAGFLQEAREWREWLLRAAAGKPSEVHIMYGLAGERRLTEMELNWLPGYENSAPVRVGNGACHQFQLDVYGEVLDALHKCWRSGMEPGGEGWRIERALLDFLESNWDQPDMGIWEVRGPKRHFTHSKMMVWVALDRGVKAVEYFGLDGPVERWQRLRDEVHAQVCCEGYNAEVGAFTQFYGSKLLDASLLMMPLVGFLPAEDPRVRATVEAIERRLVHKGFVHRYENDPEVDGLPPGEGSFLLCSFWLADNLALLRRRDDAHRLFERLLSIRNDVGLLAEAYDVEARRLVGNFPQAFSHIGLINTAFNLTRSHRGPAKERQQG